MKYFLIFFLMFFISCQFEKKEDKEVKLPKVEQPEEPEVEEPKVIKKVIKKEPKKKKVARCLPDYSWDGKKCSKMTEEEKKLQQIIKKLREKSK